MSDRKITYNDLDHLLQSFGFVRYHTPGNHRVYEHAPSDTLILLPAIPDDAVVDALHLAATRRMAVDRGAIDEDVYDKALEDLTSAALSQA